MKEWTENDSEAMFRRPPDTAIEDDRPGAVDNSEEARRRRRFPFETNAAGPAEQGSGKPGDEDRPHG